jgi:predicted ATPase
MPVLIERLQLKNFLSFGPESEPVELGPLNVLIGPNASGKSNFLEAFSLLRATPGDLSSAFSNGSVVGEWLWKGSDSRETASVSVILSYPGDAFNHISPALLRYEMAFGALLGSVLLVVSELIEELGDATSGGITYFTRNAFQANILARTDPANPGIRETRSIGREDMLAHQSILSQRRDPQIYPEITYLGTVFSRIHLYREWNVGRSAVPRLPQLSNMRPDSLDEGAGNLILVLDAICRNTQVRATIVSYLQRLHPDFEDFEPSIVGGSVQLFLREKGMKEAIPATRLSDGTLRYLALLAILCHPEPPPLVCIEEPELGLHPDIIPTIAELLVSASERTQLIVTTHSDMLVSALSEHADAVLVCERDDRGSHLERLQMDRLRPWLERYSLGELWIKGEIGGTRW